LLVICYLLLVICYLLIPAQEALILPVREAFMAAQSAPSIASGLADAQDRKISQMADVKIANI
jgi:hypothetical protein